MFTVIPAIDLTQGRLGTYTPDGPVPSNVFGGDPLEAAERFVRAGATWLHVVDMDQAFTGEPVNGPVVSSLRAAHPAVALQCSGGVGDRATAEAMLAAGATRVVMGSAALRAEEALADTIDVLGERVTIGIEVDAGRIRSRGRDPVDLDLMTCLGWLTAGGARSFIVTAVERVGTPGGPDVGVASRVARTGVPTLVAGGVATLQHLGALRAAGATGAVVGHAALTGSLDLGEAFAWASVHPDGPRTVAD